MSEIRVRFAPSPTGPLHIGGARTALFNFLFARHQKGKFILRIEDTDRERSTKESEKNILEGLKWLGLNWDEDLQYQSHFEKDHKKAGEKLLKEGKAYHCYCTPKELEVMRNQQQKKGEKPRYDGRCRNLTSPPADKKDVSPVVRFKAPKEGAIEINDLIRGKITVQAKELDDLILIRSNGTPTYNLGVVVDDASMKISHVIRGDDHLNNTPKQLLLYQALGLEIPIFAHLPMILGPDGKKLSKRHEVPSVLTYREQGYLPQALINYLVRLGWSHGDQEIFSMQEMIENFSLKQVGSSAAMINPEKLLWLNGHYIKSASDKELWQLVKPFLQSKKAKGLEDDKRSLTIMALLKERSKSLEEMIALALPYFISEVEFDPQAVKKFLQTHTKNMLKEIVNRFENVPDWNKEDLKKEVEAIAKEHQLKMVNVAQPLRVCLTGTSVSPGIYDVLEILGKKRSLERIQKGIDQIAKG